MLALIGGVILNLMPCVFPVLSIKVLALIEQAGGSRPEVRRHGLEHFPLNVAHSPYPAWRK
jgi:thiol:disulfide interchange protein